MNHFSRARQKTLMILSCLVGLSEFCWTNPVVMYGCESWTIRRLSTKELMLSNCDAGEDS